MPDDAILAIDAGTTGVTTLLLDRAGVARGRGYREIPLFHPRPGWVEQDAEEIWGKTLESVAEALQAAPQCRPVAIGIANQRETLLFWDRRNSRPMHRAVVWQCRRSSDICEALRDAGLEAEISSKTGLRIDPYFSGTKALWLTREDASLRAMVRDGSLCFGTIDSWLLWRLSGGQAHATDVTNASRTLAFDIERLDWDDGLLDLFGLHRRVMPEVRPSAAVYATTVAAGPLPAGLPVAALAGDQQAALYGQCCFEDGMTKATYGTGCFVLTHTGGRSLRPDGGLLTTIAATTAPGQRRYALEGSIFVAGAAMQWCREQLGIVGTAVEAEALARGVPDSGGVVFVPAFAGLGSPHWRPDVRGAIFGLSGGSTKAHILRAALESMAFQAQDVLESMAAHAPLRELHVDGGVAASDFLMQMQADLSGLPVTRPASVESTATGAAYLAGIATGFWRDEKELAGLRSLDRSFTPGTGAAAAVSGYERWRQAVQGLLTLGLAPG